METYATQDWGLVFDAVGTALEEGGASPERELSRILADRPDLLAAARRQLAGELATTAGGAATAAEELASLAGSRCGNWHLGAELGRGGMGVVFEGEQLDPSRPVAIKLLHRDFESDEARQRFSRESQTLAELEHPGITRLYECGSWDVDGERSVPFFAMELVPGARTIVQFVRETTPGVRGIVELFLDACDAVQHGHSRAVLHCDLKPGNLLVGGDGRLRVIDFGIARSSAPEEVGLARRTASGGLAGTPGYVAPEQLDRESPDADVRSDVYSLGLVLYELLTGQPRITRVDEVFDSEARARLSEVDELSGAVPRELGSIVARAIRADPRQRFRSVAELADDLRRFLDDRPIRCAPVAAPRRARLFVRRHRGACFGAAAALLVLVAGFVTSTVGFLRAAENAEQAELEARKSSELYVFYRDLFRRAPLEAKDPASFTMAQALDAAFEELVQRRSTITDPLVLVDVTLDLIPVFRDFGQLDRARWLANDVREQLDDLVDRTDRRRVNADLVLLDVEIRAARFAVAAELGRELRAALEARPDLPADVRLFGLQRLGNAFLGTELMGEFVACLQTVVDESRGAADPEVADYFDRNAHNLATVLANLGRHDEALAMGRTALEARKRVRGMRARRTYETWELLIQVLAFTGRFDEAHAESEAAQRACREAFGGMSDIECELQSKQAKAYLIEGRHSLAAPIYEKAVTWLRGTTGDRDPRVLDQLHHWASALRGSGDPVRAESVARQVYELRLQELGDQDERTLRTAELLGLSLLDSGRHDEAVSLFETALHGFQRIDGPDDPRTRMRYANLGRALLRSGQAEAALEPLRRAAELPIPEPYVGRLDIALQIPRDLRDATLQAGMLDDALLHAEDVVYLFEEHGEIDGERIAEALTAVGGFAMLLGDADLAEASFRRALDAVESPDASFVVRPRGALAQIALSEERMVEARRHAEAMLAVEDGLPDHERDFGVRARVVLGIVALAEDRPGDAVPILEDAVGRLGDEGRPLRIAGALLGLALVHSGEDVDRGIELMSAGAELVDPVWWCGEGSRATVLAELREHALERGDGESALRWARAYAESSAMWRAADDPELHRGWLVAGACAAEKGDLDLAEPWLRGGIEGLRPLVDRGDETLARGRISLAAVLADRDRWDEASELAKEILEDLGEDHPARPDAEGLLDGLEQGAALAPADSSSG